MRRISDRERLPVSRNTTLEEMTSVRAYEAAFRSNLRAHFVAGDKVLANFDTDQLEKFLAKAPRSIRNTLMLFGVFLNNSAWPCLASACAVFKIPYAQKAGALGISRPLFVAV